MENFSTDNLRDLRFVLDDSQMFVMNFKGNVLKL